MQNKELSIYLGKCIQKIRYEIFSQDELAYGICSKYTLSRLENGKIPTDLTIIMKLVNRLGYYYKDVADLTIINALLRHLIAEIEYCNMDSIIEDIISIEEIIARNHHNILFYDYELLCHYLHAHYIDEKPYTIQTYDLNTLAYLPKPFQIIAISVISENTLLYHDIHSFIQRYQTFPKGNKSIITDFFFMLYLQYNKKTLEVNDIFNYHKEELSKDTKTYQLIRYRSVLALGFIEYEPKKAMRHFQKIALVHQKSNQKNAYYYIAAAGQAYLYVKSKNYDAAYSCFEECIHQYPKLIRYAAPYMILLSFRLYKKIDTVYLQKGYSDINDACIDYYHFRSSDKKGAAHVKYMSNIFPKVVKSYHINDPLVILLRKEELYQVDRSYCYKSGIRFYRKLKANCKEEIVL